MEYIQLRAELDAAFDRLLLADRKLRLVRQYSSPTDPAQEIARQEFDRAMEAYRACRNSLGDYLLLHPAAAADSPGQWQVRFLAHRLWEEAGRPMGRAEEHWFQAEQMLSGGH